jgi:hypothetical protein
VKYEEALEQALVLAEDEGALETFLARVPEWAPRLRAALEVSRLLEAETQSVRPLPAALERVEERVFQAVDARRRLGGRSGLAGRIMATWDLLPGPRRAMAAGMLGLSIALVSLVALPLIQGGQSAQAVVIRGSVSEVGTNILTVNQDGRASTIKLNPGTSLTDGVGNPIGESALSPGQSVVLHGKRVGDEVVAESLEVENHIFGFVMSITPDLLILTTSQGTYEIIILPGAEIGGSLVPGTYVEVEVQMRADGRLEAHEIEVRNAGEEDEQEGGAGDDEDESSPDSPLVPGDPQSTLRPASNSGTVPAAIPDDEEDEPEPETPRVIATSIPATPFPGAPQAKEQTDPTKGPEPTKELELTEAPEPTESPESLEELEQDEEPEEEQTPEPTEAPEPTEVPETHEGVD